MAALYTLGLLVMCFLLPPVPVFMLRGIPTHASQGHGYSETC
jgi:uncharacterized membrane protein YqaE (UPF0057 family)